MARALPVFQFDDVQIASPCNMKWEDMTGGDRVRHCAACQKNVFNLSAMKRSEAITLLEATEGKICARFFRRSDGTILTADCPVGLALVARRAKRLALGAMATSLGAVAAVLAFLAQTPLKRGCDLPGMRAAVVNKVVALQTEQQKLPLPIATSPEVRSHDAVAGGLRMPSPEEMKQMRAAEEQRQRKLKSRRATPPPANEDPGFLTGDVAMPDDVR